MTANKLATTCIKLHMLCYIPWYLKSFPCHYFIYDKALCQTNSRM